MRYLALLIGVCLLASVIVLPAGAFKAERLEISLNDGGGADIDFHYSLSWFEYAMVFLQVVDPAEELQSALSRELKSEVSVQSTSGSSTQLSVEKFATVRESGGRITMITPGISFTRSQQILDKYWFAPLVNPDFSPSVIEMGFPDGFIETWNDVDTILPVTHEWQG